MDLVAKKILPVVHSLAQHPCQQVAPPSASGQPRNYTGTSDIDYIQDFINQAFSLTGQSVFIHKNSVAAITLARYRQLG